MSTANYSPFLFFLFLFLSALSFIKTDDLRISQKIKTSLQQSDPNLFSSWVSTSFICNFTGITWNSDCAVKEIELSHQKLMGTLPLDSICELPLLDKLSFGFNSLNVLVLEDLEKCTKLRYLDLGNNFFTGSFPSVSNLSYLRFLYLNTSGIFGVFPWISLENMTKLVSLNLDHYNFDPTPFPKEVMKLDKLNFLFLTNCSLEGRISPEIGSLTELINWSSPKTISQARYHRKLGASKSCGSSSFISTN